MTYIVVKRHENSAVKRNVEYRSKSRSHDWRSIGAVVGLTGGIVSALVGSVLTAASWFIGASGVDANVRTMGTVLLLLMIPLLIFGAHCLDLTEKRKKAERTSRFKD